MYIFIVNPLSGNGQALLIWTKLEKLLQEQQITYTLLNSTSEVETNELLAKHLHLKNITAVGVIGGDGTMSSVIQTLAETTIPIAIFPAGSGNDTVRMFRLTDDPGKFLKGILNGRTSTIDLLNANGRFGITVAGTGVDAIIGNKVNQSVMKPIFNKLGIGSLSYTIAAVIALLTFRPFEGTITIDGKKQVLNKAWLIACGNTVSYGGGLTICPYALPTDGLLNITMLHNTGRVNVLLRLFPALLRGKPILKPGISYEEGKTITIETNRPIPSVVDGEIITSTPLQITVHEKALQLLITT